MCWPVWNMFMDIWLSVYNNVWICDDLYYTYYPYCTQLKNGELNTNVCKRTRLFLCHLVPLSHYDMLDARDSCVCFRLDQSTGTHVHASIRNWATHSCASLCFCYSIKCLQAFVIVWTRLWAYLRVKLLTVSLYACLAKKRDNKIHNSLWCFYGAIIQTLDASVLYLPNASNECCNTGMAS